MSGVPQGSIFQELCLMMHQVCSVTRIKKGQLHANSCSLAHLERLLHIQFLIALVCWCPQEKIIFALFFIKYILVQISIHTHKTLNIYLPGSFRKLWMLLEITPCLVKMGKLFLQIANLVMNGTILK